MTGGCDGLAGGSDRRISRVQKGLTVVLEPSLEDTLLHHFSSPEGAGPIHYADFGCSAGANTINYAKFVVEALNSRPEIRGRDIVCHFADLPTNDFNTLFNQLPPIVGQGNGDASNTVEERTWFAAGVPGSQYGRMFPRSSLHVAISTLSLHFLPEIPKSVVDKSSPAYNKGCISAHGANPAAAAAFAEASRKGLRSFFECRAEELAPGGVLAFYCTGRRDLAHPEMQYPDDTINFTLMLEKAFKELVNEGSISEELLDSYNVKSFSPSVGDIQEAIEHPTTAFRIHKLEYIPDFRVFPDNAGDIMFRDAQSFASFLTNMFRSGTSSSIVPHLGPELAELLFERVRHKHEQEYPKWRDTNFGLTLSLCLAILIRAT